MPMRYKKTMYVNLINMKSIKYICLIGTQCQEKNKGMTKIMNICLVLMLWYLRHFV